MGNENCCNASPDSILGEFDPNENKLQTPKNSQLSPQEKMKELTKSQKKEEWREIKPQSFLEKEAEKSSIPDKLKQVLGVIILKEINSNKLKIIGGGMLIGKEAVLTAVNIVLDPNQDLLEPFQNLSFLSLRDQRQYKVLTVRLNESLLIYHGSRNAYDTCTLVLAQQVSGWMGFPIAMGVSKSIGLLYHPILSYHEDELQGHLEKIGDYSLNEAKNMISCNFSDNSLKGGPILMYFQENWFLIGVRCGKDETGFSLSKIFSRQLTMNVIHHVKVAPGLQKIEAYTWEGSQLHSLRQEIQQLIKLIKEPFIYESKQITTQQQLELNSYNKFCGELFFEVVNKNFECIAVNGVKLQFQLASANKSYTINDLNHRYFQKTGKQLILRSEKIILPQSIPLNEVMKMSSDVRNFELLLNFFNNPSHKIDTISSEYLIRIQKITSRYQARALSKYKLILIKIKRSSINLASIDEIYYPIQRRSTISDVINFLKENYFYNFQNFQVFSSKSKQLLNNFDKNIQNYENEGISIVFLDFERYFSNQTKMKLQSNKQIFLNGNLRVESKLTYVLSFDEAEHKLSYEFINIFFPQRQPILKYLTLIYEHDNKRYQLDCTKDALLKLYNSDWISARLIKAGTQLLGINDEQTPQLVKYKVIQVQHKQNNQKKEFFNIEVNSTHTFLANQLVVHNDDRVMLKLKIFINNEEVKYEEIHVNKKDLINVTFPESRVFLGQFELHKNLTFGDYLLKDEQFLEIVPQKVNKYYLKQNTSNIMISKWKQRRNESNLLVKKENLLSRLKCQLMRKNQETDGQKFLKIMYLEKFKRQQGE